MKFSKNLKITQIAFFSSICAISLIFLRFPIILSANFLIFDLSLVPILFYCTYFNFSGSVIILVIVSFIQTFLFNINGLVGSFMYFYSLFLFIFFFNFFDVYKKTFLKQILNFTIILTLTILFVLPLNYIFLFYLYLIPKNVVIELLFSAVVPFNLIKLSSNYFVFLLIINLFKRKIIKL